MPARAIANFVWTTAFTGAMSVYSVLRQVPHRDAARFRRHTRFWATNVLRGVGIEVATFGADQLEPDGAYVFMANHQSHVDIPTLFVALPMVPGFLAKAELRRVPLFGRAMEVGGHVFVDRKKHEDAVAAIREAAEDLREGGSIVIFPEGTRSSKKEVLPFKKGGFHLAKQARVRLVPVGIRGTGDLLPKRSKAMQPGRVEVHVGAPIEPDELDALSLEALMDEVRARIGALADLPLAKDRQGAR